MPPTHVPRQHQGDRVQAVHARQGWGLVVLWLPHQQSEAVVPAGDIRAAVRPVHALPQGVSHAKRAGGLARCGGGLLQELLDDVELAAILGRGGALGLGHVREQGLEEVDKGVEDVRAVLEHGLDALGRLVHVDSCEVQLFLWG